MTREAAKERILKVFDNEHWGASEVLDIVLNIEAEANEASFESVLFAASMAMNVTTEKVLKKERKREVVLARNLCFLYLRGKGYTLQFIGDKFGKSHCTVKHSLTQIEKLISINDKIVLAALERFDTLIPIK